GRIRLPIKINNIVGFIVVGVVRDGLRLIEGIDLIGHIAVEVIDVAGGVAEAIDDDFSVVAGAVNELVGVAAGVHYGDEPAGAVVVVTRHGNAIGVLHGGDVVREIGVVVIVLVGDVRACGAVYQFEDLNEVAGV